MEITTLEDLKKALVDIPDEVLKRFGAGINPDGGVYVELLCWGEDETEFVAYYIEQEKKYPQLKDTSNWIKAIAKEQGRSENNHEDDILQRDSPISSAEIPTKKQ